MHVIDSQISYRKKRRQKSLGNAKFAMMYYFKDTSFDTYLESIESLITPSYYNLE